MIDRLTLIHTTACRATGILAVALAKKSITKRQLGEAAAALTDATFEIQKLLKEQQ